ncbi:MAG: branched-chain amino acid transport system ATP-binding protein [Gaiellaceae bacterium]|jgi:branched-chain amino acid transport system ATP-binding protein|nr:branched-chain amino acid transport system ATP-binding protein [Gaiellaceae bacterium]
MAPLLELKDVSARYGPVAALHGVSLTVEDGEIVALLGANGAGKTTTLRAVSGTVRRSGDVVFAGKRLGRAGPEQSARAGIAHVPEGRGIFAELTVWENLRMGAYMRRGRPDFTTVLEYFPWLEARRNQQAGTLSGGEQQMLALARAFLQQPRLLMLDEPSLGLAPLVTREVFRVVGDLNRKEGLAVLVVEQNAAIALGAAQRAYVLETGTISISGTADDLKSDDAVRSAYLGY